MAGRRIFARLTALGAFVLLAGTALKPPPCTPETCPAQSRPSEIAFTAPHTDCCPPAVEPLPDATPSGMQKLAPPVALSCVLAFAPPAPVGEPGPLADVSPPPRGTGPPLFVLNAAFLI